MPYRPAPNLRRAIAATPTRLALGPLFSEGARLLWSKLAASSVDSIAATVGLDPSVVRLHLYGDRRPVGATRDAYVTGLGIPGEAWDAPPSKPFTLPALAAMAERVRAVLAKAGGDGLDLAAIGEACAFAKDPYERAFLALSAVYLTGLAECIPGTGRFRLAQRKSARGAA